MDLNKIKDYLIMLDAIADDISFYKEFEISLLLFLRSDTGILPKLNKKIVNKLAKLTENCASLLDLDKYEIDEILEEVA